VFRSRNCLKEQEVVRLESNSEVLKNGYRPSEPMVVAVKLVGEMVVGPVFLLAAGFLCFFASLDLRVSWADYDPFFVNSGHVSID